MPTSLIVGASRGLGRALALSLSSGSLGQPHKVYGTVRSPPRDQGDDLLKTDKVELIDGVDLTSERCAKTIVEGLEGNKVDYVWLVAGLLVPEKFEPGGLKWDAEVDMYKICAIAPTFIIQALVQAQLLTYGAKVAYFTSEGGSIALTLGGGMYGHHGSKAAANMTGKILSLDLKPLGIPVFILHPSFMRTDMTASAFGKSEWDKPKGSAVPPSEAIPKIWDFVHQSGMDRSGEFWAPNGGDDIGSAEEVLGKNLPTPLRLPW